MAYAGADGERPRVSASPRVTEHDRSESAAIEAKKPDMMALKQQSARRQLLLPRPCCFLHDHLGHPIPSPALLQPRHDAFVAAVERFAAQRHVPLIHFDPRARKDDVVAPDREAFTAREGVVVFGVA